MTWARVVQPAQPGRAVSDAAGLPTESGDDRMKKVALFAFNGEATCFAHVLLNALDMQEKGFEVRVIIEAEATKQVSLLRNETKPYADLYKRVKDAGLIDCVCKACATKFGALNAAIQQGLGTCGEMSGHPSIARYKEEGYEVLVF
jgi:hypothetical protein